MAVFHQRESILLFEDAFESEVERNWYWTGERKFPFLFFLFRHITMRKSFFLLLLSSSGINFFKEFSRSICSFHHYYLYEFNNLEEILTILWPFKTNALISLKHIYNKEISCSWMEFLSWKATVHSLSKESIKNRLKIFSTK